MPGGGRRGLCWKGFWREILPSSLCGGGVWSAGGMRGSGWPALVGKVGCMCLCERGGEKGRESERERERHTCTYTCMHACIHECRNTYMHTYMYACTHTRIYTYIHGRASISSPPAHSTHACPHRGGALHAAQIAERSESPRPSLPGPWLLQASYLWTQRGGPERTCPLWRAQNSWWR